VEQATRKSKADGKPPAKRYQVPALKRAFAILDTLNNSSTGLTVQEISQEHKIPYSTAFYLLETMQDCGYTQRTAESKRYAIGHKLLALRESAGSHRHLNLRSIALPLMDDLTASTGLTCHLAKLERDEAVYVEKTEPSGFIRLNTWVGRRNALHSSGVGKALLLHMSEQDVRRLFGGEALPRHSDRTLSTVSDLLEDLRAGRERGYAFDDGEDEHDGRCVAACVFDGSGAVAASLSVSGTISQIDSRRMEALGRLVRDTALQISELLGYVRPSGA